MATPMKIGSAPKATGVIPDQGSLEKQLPVKEGGVVVEAVGNGVSTHGSPVQVSVVVSDSSPPNKKRKKISKRVNKSLNDSFEDALTSDSASVEHEVVFMSCLHRSCCRIMLFNYVYVLPIV